MPEIITKKRNTPTKKRSSSCYQKKIDKITTWYNNLLKCRENPKRDNLINPNTKTEPKRKLAHSLDWYIDKIKKPKGNE
jgi:hypothetical protein